MLDFIDEKTPPDATWSRWAENHPRAPSLVSRLDLSDESERISGVFVTPANVAMGLRGWEDADEGIEGDAAWVLFDLEKIIRMILHQSGLAFETLVAPPLFTVPDFDPRRLAASATTRGVIDYYADITRALEQGVGERWRWRSLLTAVLLVRESAVSVSLPTLLDAVGEPDLRPLEEGPLEHPELARALRAELSERGSLPEQPIDYDWLDELLVTLRLEAMR